MADNRVVINIVAAGAQEAAKAIESISASGAKVGTVMASGAGQVDKFGVSIKAAGDHSDQASISLSQLGGILGRTGETGSMLGAVLGALTSPLALVAETVGLMALGFHKATASVLGQVEATKQMMAVSGLGAEAADDLINTMQLLGVDTGMVTRAMFKMAQEIDSGGEGLGRLGVSIRDSSGHLKLEGDLFLEVRGRLSGLGSAQERAAAAQMEFGRSAREMLPLFALTQAQYLAMTERVKGYSDWNEQAQQTGTVFSLSLKEVGLAAEGLWQKIGLQLAPGLTDANLAFAAMVKAVKDGVEPAFQAVAPILGLVGSTFAGFGPILSDLLPFLKSIGAVALASFGALLVGVDAVLIPLRGLAATMGAIAAGNWAGALEAGKDAMLAQADATAKAALKLDAMLLGWTGLGPAAKTANEMAADATEKATSSATRQSKAELDAHLANIDKALRAQLDALDIEAASSKLAATAMGLDAQALLRTQLDSLDDKMAAVTAAEKWARDELGKTFDLQASLNPAVQKLLDDLTDKYQKQYGDIAKAKLDNVTQLVKLDSDYFTAYLKAATDTAVLIAKQDEFVVEAGRKMALDLTAFSDSERQAIVANEEEKARVAIEKIYEVLGETQTAADLSVDVIKLRDARIAQFDSDQTAAYLREVDKQGVAVEALASHDLTMIGNQYGAQAAIVGNYYAYLLTQDGLSAAEIEDIERRKNAALTNIGDQYQVAVTDNLLKRVTLEGQAAAATRHIWEDAANLELVKNAATIDQEVRDRQKIIDSYTTIGNASAVFAQQELDLWAAKSKAIGDWGGFFAATFATAFSKGTEFWDSVSTLAISAFGAMKAGASDFFFAIGQFLTGQLKTWQDFTKALRSVWTSMLNSFLRAASDFLASGVMRGLASVLAGGAFGAGFTGTAGAGGGGAPIGGGGGTTGGGSNLLGMLGNAPTGFLGSLDTLTNSFDVFTGSLDYGYSVMDSLLNASTGITSAFGAAIPIIGAAVSAFSLFSSLANGTLTGMSGALSGAGLGASIGTAISPGIGTAIGAAVGALGGWLLSLFGGGPTLSHAQREQLDFSALGQQLKPLTEQLSGTMMTAQQLVQLLTQWGSGYTGGTTPVAVSTQIRTPGGPYPTQIIGQPNQYYPNTMSDPNAILTALTADPSALIVSIQRGLTQGLLDPLNAALQQMILDAIARINEFEKILTSIDVDLGGTAKKLLPDDLYQAVKTGLLDPLKAGILALESSGKPLAEVQQGLKDFEAQAAAVAKAIQFTAELSGTVAATLTQASIALPPALFEAFQAGTIDPLKASMESILTSGASIETILAQLTDLGAKVAPIAGLVSLYDTINQEVAGLGGNMAALAARQVDVIHANMGALDAAVATSTQALADSLGTALSPKEELQLLADAHQAIVNRYAYERQQIEAVEKTIGGLVQSFGAPLADLQAQLAGFETTTTGSTATFDALLAAYQTMAESSISATLQLNALSLGLDAVAAQAQAMVLAAVAGQGAYAITPGTLADPSGVFAAMTSGIYDAAAPFIARLQSMVAQAEQTGDLQAALSLLQQEQKAVQDLASVAIKAVKDWATGAKDAVTTQAAAQIAAINDVAKAQIAANNAEIKAIDDVAKAQIAANNAEIKAIDAAAKVQIAANNAQIQSIKAAASAQIDANNAQIAANNALVAEITGYIKAIEDLQSTAGVALANLQIQVNAFNLSTTGSQEGFQNLIGSYQGMLTTATLASTQIWAMTQGIAAIAAQAMAFVQLGIEKNAGPYALHNANTSLNIGAIAQIATDISTQAQPFVDAMAALVQQASASGDMEKTLSYLQQEQALVEATARAQIAAIQAWQSQAIDALHTIATADINAVNATLRVQLDANNQQIDAIKLVVGAQVAANRAQIAMITEETKQRVAANNAQIATLQTQLKLAQEWEAAIRPAQSYLESLQAILNPPSIADLQAGFDNAVATFTAAPDAAQVAAIQSAAQAYLSAVGKASGVGSTDYLPAVQSVADTMQAVIDLAMAQVPPGGSLGIQDQIDALNAMNTDLQAAAQSQIDALTTLNTDLQAAAQSQIDALTALNTDLKQAAQDQIDAITTSTQAEIDTINAAAADQIALVNAQTNALLSDIATQQQLAYETLIQQNEDALQNATGGQTNTEQFLADLNAQTAVLVQANLDIQAAAQTQIDDLLALNTSIQDAAQAQIDALTLLNTSIQDAAQAQIDALTALNTSIQDAAQLQIDAINAATDLQLTAIDNAATHQIDAINTGLNVTLANLAQQEGLDYAALILQNEGILGALNGTSANTFDAMTLNTLNTVTELQGLNRLLSQYLGAPIPTPPSAQHGAYRTRDAMYQLHGGEMVLPREVADAVRGKATAPASTPPPVAITINLTVSGQTNGKQLTDELMTELLREARVGRLARILQGKV